MVEQYPCIHPQIVYYMYYIIFMNVHNIVQNIILLSNY